MFSAPDELERQLRAQIEELQAEQQEAHVDCEKLTWQLDELQNERQKIITWGRKEIISEADMAMQLAGLDWQRNSLQSELNKAQLLTGDRAAQLIGIAENYRRDVTVGRELLALKNRTPDQEQEVLNFKRRIIKAFVTRVDVLADKSIEVHGILKLSEGTKQLVANSPKMSPAL